VSLYFPAYYLLVSWSISLRRGRARTDVPPTTPVPGGDSP
jgi:hypothetical protein